MQFQVIEAQFQEILLDRNPNSILLMATILNSEIFKLQPMKAILMQTKIQAVQKIVVKSLLIINSLFREITSW